MYQAKSVRNVLRIPGRSDINCQLAGLLATANDNASEYRRHEIDEMPWHAAPHSSNGWRDLVAAVPERGRRTRKSVSQFTRESDALVYIGTSEAAS